MRIHTRSLTHTDHRNRHAAEREGKARGNGEMGALDTHQQIAGTAKQARGGRKNTSVKAGARL